jgi:succinate-semialdehyde dehydrogenase/glutarate-semialdehyde dehydrogenase
LTVILKSGIFKIMLHDGEAPEFEATPPAGDLPAESAGPAAGERAEDFALLARRVRATGDLPGIDVVDPFTGMAIGRVPSCRPEDVASAAARARAAQPRWAAMSFRQRGRVFARFDDLLLSRQKEILDIIQLENGKTRVQAFEEVMATASAALYYAFHSRGHLKTRRRAGAMPLLTTTREARRPRGLVGFITPWNYPLTMGITDALAALAAGNSVLLKPDHQTPFSALWAIGLLEQAGMPADVAVAVTGDGPTLGPPIVENVDFLMFTGSTRVGKLLAAQAGERLIECSMELGGKNAMLVMQDADLDRTARGAISGSFSNAGQLCIAMERIYVHSSQLEDFVERLARRVGRLRIGGGLDWSNDVGPLISQQQFDRVKAHVEDAVANGATVRAGGRARPDIGPLFFEPTVLTGVTAAAACFGEETFGPVISIYPYEELDTAIEQINTGPYGLNASVWTGDPRRGARIAERIEAGTVNVNEAYAAAFGSTAAPMGGMKQSGMGRRHGAYGIQKYTESQTVAVQRLLPISPPMEWNGEIYSKVMTGVLALKRRSPGMR